jgi:hypothetical protein
LAAALSLTVIVASQSSPKVMPVPTCFSVTGDQVMMASDP